MMKWITRSVFTMIILILVFFVYLMTPSGFRHSIQLLEHNISGKLSFEKINGNIFSPINFTGMKFSNKTMTVNIDKGHLEWRLPMLLFSKLDIANITANKVQIIQKASSQQPHSTKALPSTESNKAKPLTLPYGLIIESAAIQQITLLNPNHHILAKFKNFDIEKLKLTENIVKGNINFDLVFPYSIQNHLALNGRLANYQLKWLAIERNKKFILTGNGSNKAIALRMKNNPFLNGKMSADIHFSWYPFVTWNSDIQLHHANLKTFSRHLPTISKINIKTSGSWQNKIPVFTVNAVIRAPGTNIKATGGHNKKWNLSWKLNIQQLQKLYSSYQGSVASTGTIRGSTNSPLVDATINANKIQVLKYHANSLSAKLNVDLAWQQASKLQLNASGLVAPYFSAKQIHLIAKGNKALKKISLNTSFLTESGENTSLKLLANGTLATSGWNGSLTQAQLNAANSGAWQLLHPAAISVKQTAFQLQTACLQSTYGKTCLSAHWNQFQSWALTMQGHSRNIRFLSGLVSKNIELVAPGKFDIVAKGDSQSIKMLQAAFDISNGDIRFTDSYQSINIPLQHILLKLNTENNNLIAKASIKADKTDNLQINATLQDFTSQPRIWNQLPIQGNINLNLNNANFLQLFVSGIAKPKGQIHGNLKIDGNLPNPNITGKLILKDGSIEIPSLKITLTDLKADMIAKNHHIDFTASASSAGKIVNINGNSQLQNNAIITHLRLKGNDILIANTAQYTIYASPDLKARFIGTAAVITGDILIPRALLRPADFSSTETLPADTVIIGKDQSIENKPLDWLININMALGDQVKIDSHGLKGQLVGKLKVSREQNQSTAIASGQLSLKHAIFTAQGKKLAIAPGSSINYIHDNITNPHLNVRASRNVTISETASSLTPLSPTQAQVGIDIKGTLKHPVITLFSSPVSLSQGDILSYLLFGTSSTGTSAGNLSMIVQAVSSLKLGNEGSSSSIAAIKQKLGITELGVEQQLYVDALGTPLGIDQSAFVIGSYITPHIYIRYNRGLLSPVTIYQVRYIFNKNWSIQTETGTGTINGSQAVGSGGDILYTISRKHFPW